MSTTRVGMAIFGTGLTKGYPEKYATVKGTRFVGMHYRVSLGSAEPGVVFLERANKGQ